MPAGIDKLANNVPVSTAEWTARYRVPRRFRGPEAEAIVVLRGEDHRLEARIPRRSRPLRRIETRRVEDGRVFFPFSPLPVRERVHAEVDEHREFVALPGQLGERRHRSTRLHEQAAPVERM